VELSSSSPPWMRYVSSTIISDMNRYKRLADARAHQMDILKRQTMSTSTPEKEVSNFKKILK
jgi:hypothetical protein